MIRITSGKLRGQKIESPNSALTHPMGAREKLALFNMIADYLPGARVLDAYAGSGALGIEAMSRGASEVVFIEKNAKTCKIIRNNLKILGLEARILIMDANELISSEKFDVILLDPPYDDYRKSELAHFSSNLVRNGVLALSHPGEAPDLPGLKLRKSRKYAGANLSVYEQADS